MARGHTQIWVLLVAFKLRSDCAQKPESSSTEDKNKTADKRKQNTLVQNLRN